MKVIIAGSRDINLYRHVCEAVCESGFKITEVVSGGARGADKLGEQWATVNKVPIKVFPADWGKHGRAAGPIRNTEMGRYGDALIALWDGQSKGTYHMIQTAKHMKIPVFIWRVDHELR